MNDDQTLPSGDEPDPAVDALRGADGPHGPAAPPSPAAVEAAREALLARVALPETTAGGARDEVGAARARRRWVRRAAVVGVAAAALVVAGTAGVLVGPGRAPTGVVPVAAAAELTPFDDCDALRDHEVDAARSQVTAYGWGDGSGYWTEGTLLRPLAVTDDLAARTAAYDLVADDAVANGETGTNTQEAGVDEPDVAKTNGDLAVTVDGPELLTWDVSGEAPERLGSLSLPTRWGNRLLLTGDTVLVVADEEARSPVVPYFEGDSVLPATGTVDASTTLTTVDVSDPTSPTVTDRTTIDAELVSARESDGTVRVATTNLPDLAFVQPGQRFTPAQALAENRRVLAETTGEDWLPAATDPDGASAPLLDCVDVARPDRPAGAGTITLLTLGTDDLTRTDGLSSPAATGVAAAGDLVYASADRTYVATTRTVPRTLPLPVRRGDLAGVRVRYVPPRTVTDVHAFATDGDTTTYVASGRVRGGVEDRWSFSELDGDLRVVSAPRGSLLGGVYAVSVLREEDGRLREVGRVGGIGAGEDLKAVRWFDDVAVLVTFRRVDPLHTVDLADPTDPRVVGELTVPGFSSYLHPLGDGLLLGVGRGGGGVAVSTFDLADLADVRRVGTVELERWSRTTVSRNPRSFTYLPDQRLAFVPVEGGRGRSGDRVQVLRVGTDGALDVAGELDLRAAGRPRVLPLDGDRVAVVSGGEVTELIDVTGIDTDD